jgi:hypothetical protein
MQSKLTLRMEEAVIRKAKRLARRKGKSVSLLVSEYFAEQPDNELDASLPPVTSSMIGVLSKGTEVNEEDYKKYLEVKYL